MSVKKSSATRKKRIIETPVIEENLQNASSKPSRGPSNLLIILLIIVSFFAGYLFFKVKSLEQNTLGAADAKQQANQQANNPLSTDNLKKYAKDLKLDTNKFNACLDKGDKKSTVDNELKIGSGVGVQGTPGFFINGKKLGGAFPFEMFREIIDKELSGQSSESCADYSTELQQYCDDTGKDQNKPFNPVSKTVETNQPVARGPEDAKVTIIEFSDFQCPYCIRAYPTVKKVLSTYNNDVKLVYMQFPLNNIHPFAQKASEAALCAQDQGKFWEMHDKLFESQGATNQ